MQDKKRNGCGQLVNFKDVPKNFPTESGIYAVRKNPESNWYNLIIEVIGEVPFLRISNVMLRFSRIKREDESLIQRIKDNPEALCWGPKLEAPEVPKNEQLESCLY